MAKAQLGGQRIGGKDYPSGAMLPQQYRRVLDDSDRPRDPAGSNPLAAPNLGRFTVPQLITFSSISTTLSKAYRNPDEAYRHSIENAHMMLSDPTIAGPLHARQMMTSLLQWSVESEDDKDPQLKAAALTLSKILEKTPRFTELRRSLLEAIWYGRCATQQAFGFHTDRHRQRFRVIKKWAPVSGDKLLFRYDDGSYEYDPDQIGVRMAWLGREDALAGKRRLEPTSDGLGYFLEPWERRHWCVHKHMIRDGEYEDPLSAGQIHGVGLRHFLYWTWYQKQETMAQVVEVIERTGMGITIYYYPLGNAEAEAQVKKVAQEQAHTNILAMPYDPATGGQDYNIQQIPPNTAGLQVLTDIVDHYYGDMIVRFILGQTLSSKPSATGMNTGVADLQKDSLYDIVRYDAVNLQESITREILLPLRDFNLFQFRSVEFFFKISTKVSAPQEELAAIQQAWQMGAKIRVQDLFAKLDLAMPDKDDKTVFNPQIVGAIQQVENPSAFSPPGGVGPQPPGATPSSPGPMDQNELLPPEGAPPEGEPEQLDKAPDPAAERQKLFGPILYAKRSDYLERIREAVENTEPNPSEAQRAAGNYRKGVVHWHGLEIVIETPKGQRRRPEWPALRAHYGYIRRHYHSGEQRLVTTEPCADGDHLDIFLGPELDSEIVFVIDQTKQNGSWDEHKCLLGCTNKRAARELYLSNYPDGWKCGPIRGLTVQTFKHWIQHGDLSKPIAKQKLRYAKGRQLSLFDEDEHPRSDDGKFTDKQTTPSPEKTASTKGEASQQGARRTRSSVHFDKPITGPSGASLIAYDWKWMWEEGPEHDDPVRVSDWSEAELNEHTGRNIVHQFHVTDSKGPHVVSLESALKILGFDDGSEGMAKVKTLAMASMQLAEAQQQHQQLEDVPAADQTSEHHYALQRSQDKIENLKKRVSSLTREAALAASGESPVSHYRNTFRKAMELRSLFHTDTKGNQRQQDTIDDVSRESVDKLDHAGRRAVYDEGKAVYSALMKATRHNILGEATHKTPVPDEIPERTVWGRKVKAVPAWSDAKIRNWYLEHGENVEAAIENAMQWLQRHHPQITKLPRKYAKDALPGGRADNVALASPALTQGTAVELEHTDNPAIASEIASDHLVESPAYYDALKRMEAALKANATRLRKRLEYIKELGEYEAEPIQYGCNCQQRYGKDDEDSVLHLLGHIGDSDFGCVSESPEWLSAWQSELNGGALSGEAAESPAEGLAEYIALVLRSPQEAHDRYPDCWEVLEIAGLVEEDDDSRPERYAYEESEHPRDQGGRWTEKDGGGMFHTSPVKDLVPKIGDGRTLCLGDDLNVCRSYRRGGDGVPHYTYSASWTDATLANEDDIRQAVANIGKDLDDHFESQPYLAMKNSKVRQSLLDAGFDGAEYEDTHEGANYQTVELLKEPEGFQFSLHSADESSSPDIEQYRDVRLERVKEDDDLAAAAEVATRAGLGSLHYMNREPLLVHRDYDGRINGVILADTDGGLAFDFAVDPDSQGGGIGTKLVQGIIGYYLRNREKLAAKQDMEPEGYDLTAIASNPVAEQMLLKAGFRKDGEELVIRGQDVAQ